MKTFQYFVGNAWHDPASGQFIDSENPAIGEVWARVPDCNQADVERAVAAARAAFHEGPWGRMMPAERGRQLRRIGDVISKHADRLGEIETRDNGKLPRNITPSLKPGAWQVDSWHYYAGMCDKFEGSLIPAEMPDMHNYLKWEPFGVCGLILPWNSPIGTLIWKLAPCLAAGNTVVMKPSEQSSCSTLELMDVLLEADLPPGVLNVVTGGGSRIGAELVSNPITKLVTMTGSVGTGVQLNRLAAENMTAVRLELGGKAPFIVMDDADLDRAVECAVISRFLNCGQVCTCNERMYLHDAIYDAFMDRFLAACRELKMGDPMESDTDIGPKVSQSWWCFRCIGSLLM